MAAPISGPSQDDQLAHLRALAEALHGLEYAHGLSDFDGTSIGVVHRDMTPQNVVVTFDGQVKVVDFGIAKSADSSLETRTGVLKGKPSYMPPVQTAGTDTSPRRRGTRRPYACRPCPQ